MEKTIKLLIFTTLFVSFTSLKPMSNSYEESNTSCIPIPPQQSPNISYTEMINFMEEEKTLYINNIPNDLPTEIICKIFEQLIEQSLTNQPENKFITIDERNYIDDSINNDTIREDELAIIIVHYINNLINNTFFLDNLDIIYSISNLAEKYNLDKNKLAQEIIYSVWLKIDNKSTETILFEIITEYQICITDKFIENHAYNDHYELSDNFYDLIMDHRVIK